MSARAAAMVAAVLVLAGCGNETRGGGPPPGSFVATSRSLSPTAHLFADPVAVRIDVVVDREHLDPDRVRLRASFLPYRIVDGVGRTREDFAGFTRLRFELTLRCLTVACVPSRLRSVLGAQEGRGERRTFRFKPARILYDDPETGELRHLRRVWWPPLDAVSRLSATATGVPPGGFLAGDEFRATITPVAAPTFRISPTLLGGGLLAAALLLLAFPLAATMRTLRRRRPVEPEPELPPLERALLRVKHARARAEPTEQREALEALAFELDAGGHDERARSARRLAWSAEEPAGDRVDELVEAVRSGDGAPG